MDKKEQEVLSKHEWWIDLLSFFIFVGACLLFVLIGKRLSPQGSNAVFILSWRDVCRIYFSTQKNETIYYLFAVEIRCH